MKTNALFKCIKCSDIFRSRNDLENHVKRVHQPSVKVKFKNGGATEVKKARDNTFQCRCGKKFKLPDSLRRHAKGCNGELPEQEIEERQSELMDANDSDASEHMNVDDRIMPTDCFGTRISHKKTDCRRRRTS